MKFTLTLLAMLLSLSGMAQDIQGKKADTAGADVFTTVPPGLDASLAKNDTAVKIYCVKHGTVRMDIGGRWLYIDPVTTAVPPVTDYTSMPKADVILITHEHRDHLDSVAIRQLTKQGTVLITNPRSSALLGNAGIVMENGDAMQTAHGWTIEAVPAYNTSPEKQKYHPKGRDNGYVITIGGLRIYIAGDTEDIPEMQDMGDIDVAFLPCNLPYTMSPEQCANAARMIKPKTLFPYHYGNTDIQKVANLLNGSGIDIRIRDYQ